MRSSHRPSINQPHTPQFLNPSMTRTDDTQGLSYRGQRQWARSLWMTSHLLSYQRVGVPCCRRSPPRPCAVMVTWPLSRHSQQPSSVRRASCYIHRVLRLTGVHYFFAQSWDATQSGFRYHTSLKFCIDEVSSIRYTMLYTYYIYLQYSFNMETLTKTHVRGFVAKFA